MNYTSMFSLHLNKTWKLGDYMRRKLNNQTASYLVKISSAIERGMVAKEVVCSITTGFRSVPSIRTKPGLNPYHASVADIGYGFDAVQGTIKRIQEGESIPFVLEMLVFDLDTLRISEVQLSPNFELAVVGVESDLVHISRFLHTQIKESVTEANRLGRELLGNNWDAIIREIQNIQAVPRL